MVCYLYKIKEGAAMNKNRDISIRRIMEGQYLFDKATAEINKNTHNCDKAILHIIKNDDIKRACRQLKDAADWFDYPHPEGSRDLRGEPDFIAIRIIMALYERECYGGAAIAATQDIGDFFSLDDGKYGKGVINNSRIKFILQLEEDEAFAVQKYMSLSDEETMQIKKLVYGKVLRKMH